MFYLVVAIIESIACEMDEDSGGGPPDVRAYARYQDVDDGTETVVVDGTTIVASSSLLSTDSVRACTVMLSRDQPQVH